MEECKALGLRLCQICGKEEENSICPSWKANEAYDELYHIISQDVMVGVKMLKML